LEAVKWVNEHADLAEEILRSFRDGIRQLSPNETMSNGQLMIWPARISGTASIVSAERNLPDVYIVGSNGLIESAIRQSRAISIDSPSEQVTISERTKLVRTIPTTIFAAVAGLGAIWFYLSAAADSERRHQTLLQTVEKTEQRIVELEKQMAVQAALLAVRPRDANSTSTELREVRVVTPPPVFVVPPSPPLPSDGPAYQGRPAWIYRTN
jgi:hypothetical protein